MKFVVSIPETISESKNRYTHLKDCMLEIRLNSTVQISTINKLFNGPLQTIATCRKNVANTNDNLINNILIKQTLMLAISAGATYVDIELECPDIIQLVRFAKQKNCKVIVSHHNYDITPSSSELMKIIDSCFDYGADIAKIATMCNNNDNAKTITDLYQYYQKGTLIAIGMGELGKPTRINAHKLGCPFIFCSIDKKTLTAPGQYTIDELRSKARNC